MGKDSRNNAADVDTLTYHTAQAALEKGIKDIFLVPGIEDAPLTDVISYCWNCPATIVYLSRAETKEVRRLRRFAVARAIGAAFTAYVNGRILGEERGNGN